MKHTALKSFILAITVICLSFTVVAFGQAKKPGNAEATPPEKSSSNSGRSLVFHGTIEPTMFSLSIMNAKTNKLARVEKAILGNPKDMSSILFGIVLSKTGSGDYPPNYDPEKSIDKITPSSASKWHLFDMSGNEISVRKPFKAKVVLKLKKDSKLVWAVQSITETKEGSTPK